MEKLIYIKPEAKYVVFYSEEEITANLKLPQYANTEGGGSLGGNTSGSFGEGEGDEGSIR